jgi:hypothetical protein
MDQSNAFRFRCADPVTSQKVSPRAISSNDPREPNVATPSCNDPSFYAGVLKTASPRGVAQIARECEIQAATEAVAINRCDGDGVGSRDARHQLLPSFRELARGVRIETCKRGQIRAN